MIACWEDGTERDEYGYSVGPGRTCMLPDGHEGPHEFTPDDQIMVRFIGGESE